MRDRRRIGGMHASSGGEEDGRDDLVMLRWLVGAMFAVVVVAVVCVGLFCKFFYWQDNRVSPEDEAMPPAVILQTEFQEHSGRQWVISHVAAKGLPPARPYYPGSWIPPPPLSDRSKLT